MRRRPRCERQRFLPTRNWTLKGGRKLSGFSRLLRHWDRCVTSPTRRATQTAAALGLEATIEPMLRDCDYGRWTGRSFDEVQAQEPEALADWIKDPSAAPHGGESVVAMIARVSAWLDTQLTKPGVILAVTHASVIRAAIVCALEAEATIILAHRYCPAFVDTAQRQWWPLDVGLDEFRQNRPKHRRLLLIQVRTERRSSAMLSHSTLRFQYPVPSLPLITATVSWIS